MNNERVKGGPPYRAGWENGPETSGHLSTSRNAMVMKGWDEVVRARKAIKRAKVRRWNRAAEGGRMSQR